MAWQWSTNNIMSKEMACLNFKSKVVGFLCFSDRQGRHKLWLIDFQLCQAGDGAYLWAAQAQPWSVENDVRLLPAQLGGDSWLEGHFCYGKLSPCFFVGGRWHNSKACWKIEVDEVTLRGFDDLPRYGLYDAPEAMASNVQHAQFMMWCCDVRCYASNLLTSSDDAEVLFRAFHHFHWFSIESRSP